MRWFLLVLSVLAFALPGRAYARLFSASELEALLAPIALQSDPVLWTVLDASLAPQDAPRTLAAFPEVTAHMARNPFWITDLGQAYGGQRNEVIGAVQVLRHRASFPPSLIVVQPPVIVHAPIVVLPHPHVHLHRHPRHPHGPPSQAVRLQREQAQKYREYHNVPESRRQPIVQPWGLRRELR